MARTPYLGPSGGATSGGGRTPYLGGTAAPKRSGGGGLFGKIAGGAGHFVANLGKDIASTAVQVGPGVATLGKATGEDVLSTFTQPLHPKSEILHKVVAPTAHQYADYYGHNQLGHIYQHPLQPILDALTIADLGATAGVKVGAISGERAALVTRSPRQIATGRGPVHTEISATKPLVRKREVAASRFRAKHPEGVGVGTVRVGGEVKKYGKQIQQRASQHAMSNLVGFPAYQKATRRLSPQEWSALHIRALDVHPNDLQTLWKGTRAEPIVNDPAVRKLVVTPSAKLLKAEEAARSLSEQGGALLKGKGLLGEESAAARPSLTKRQASEALGRPAEEVTGKPYYFPHTYEPVKSASPLGARGGGKAPPLKPSTTKLATGQLAMSGKLNLRSDVLGPEFLRRVKYVKYDEIHKSLVRGAIRITRQQLEQQHGGKLPAGYEYVRERASTRIPPDLRGQGEARTPIDKLIPNADDLHDSQLAKEGFTTTDPAGAHQTKGAYYIVPTATAKAATGEFTRSSNFVHHWVNNPLKVWRSLVLGTRVGFLTNNLVGNSLMYAVKTGGQGAIRDLFGAVVETHGRETALKLLKNQATPPGLRTDLYKEFFPEQIGGTFGRTQTPSTSPLHAAGSKGAEAFRAATGAIPRVTSKVAEEYPRRALIRHYIRHSPEFRTTYRSLPKQTRTFENAARQVLEGKGGAAYQRQVSRQVNAALGDYLNLSRGERDVLRNALPFYSWYRAIATTTAHLAADTPLRANILGQIGRIGQEQSQSNFPGGLPSFLEGAIPLGRGPQGTQAVLGTQGLNPWATLGQLHRGVGTDVGSLGVNPFAMGIVNTYGLAAQRQHTPFPHLSLWGLAGQTGKEILHGLPPGQLAFPPKPSKLYPARSRKDVLLGQFGVPRKYVNPSVAAQQAREGR